MSYKIVIDGFDTKAQALGFLHWFEGQGEQDDTIGEWMHEPGSSIITLLGSLKETDEGAQCEIQIGYT